MATVPHRGPGRPPSEEIRFRREEEILEAAAKFFAERGYSTANTQDLADLLQVSKGTIFRYFPTKQDLFLAAVDRMMRKLDAELQACCVEKNDDPLEQLTAVVTAYLRFCAQHPEFPELLIQERAQFKDRKKPTYFVYREAGFERRREHIHSLIAEGRLRDIPAERIGDVIGDLLYGTMFTNYFVGRNRSPEDQAADIVDIVFHGIVTDAERNRRRSQ
jgi:AcrR family transcriptional regulator